jgi:uncharacterized protein
MLYRRKMENTEIFKEWNDSLKTLSSVTEAVKLLRLMARKIPIEIHVFYQQREYFCFDVRNYAILRLDPVMALVLNTLERTETTDIIEDLFYNLDSRAIAAAIEQVLRLLKDGTLSSTPILNFTAQSLSRLVLMLSSGCNMACSYCFEKDVPATSTPRLMSRSIAKTTILWYFENLQSDKAHLQLYGGEPLLNWKILKFVVKCANFLAKKHGVELTTYLITNGTLLDNSKAKWLVDNFVSVQVSVDGDPKTHDRYRRLKDGSATSNLVKPGVDALGALKADFNLRAVLTKSNLSPGFIIDGLRKWNSAKVSFEIVATDEKGIKLDEKDWELFNMNYQKYLAKPYSDWENIPHEMQSIILNLCQRKYLVYGCGAGVTEVTVSPMGEIYECQRLYRDPIGSVQFMEKFVPNSRGFQTPVDERPVCRDCWARYLCGGGCLHQTEKYSHNMTPYPPFCEMKKNLIESSIATIYSIRKLNEEMGKHGEVKKLCDFDSWERQE